MQWSGIAQGDASVTRDTRFEGDTQAVFFTYMADEAFLLRAQRYARHALDDAIHRIPRPAASHGKRRTGREMQPYLAEARAVVTAELVRRASPYSTLAWLWYLRRVPNLFFHKPDTTARVYDAALTETLSGIGGRVRSLTPSVGPVAYPIDRGIVKDVLRFAAGGRYLSRVHALSRLAGLGLDFTFNTEALPDDHRTAAQDEAIRLYDKRMGLPMMLGTGRLGTTLVGHPSSSPADPLLHLYPLTAGEWRPVTLFEHERSAPVKVFAAYEAGSTSLADLATLTADQRLAGITWAGPQLGALLLLSRAAFDILTPDYSRVADVLRFGYHLTDREELRRILAWAIDGYAGEIRRAVPGAALPATGDEFLALLEGSTGSPWPLRHGPTVRCDGNAACVDFRTMTVQLEELLEFPATTGIVANVRAQHLEDSAQRIIDDSPWAPARDVRAYWRRTLRCGGKNLTDLDAIGVHGDTLLIVSCKSVIYSTAYDIGDHAAVRNATDTIVRACQKWEEIRRFLAAHPVGQNYDFARFRRIIAVVCTPLPVSVPRGDATREIATGLTAAVSLSELHGWLNSDTVID
jgi:hypothetical protein